MPHNNVEILLVEDNPADVRLFEDGLSGPYHVAVARDGAEALDRLFQRGKFHTSPRPDIVVLDLNIPLINGHEVLNAIKSNSLLRSIPTIVFSVSSDRDDVQKAYDFGASAYLVKQKDLHEAEKTLTAFVDFWIERVSYPALLEIPRQATAGNTQ